MQLSKRIRDLRLRRGLTVQRLGEATGLSKGFISQVENGRTSPSLATLRDLARALETSVAYLVAEEDRMPYVVRAGERPRLQVGGSTTRVELLSAQPRRDLQVILVELQPGVATRDRQHYHHGEEVVLCLEGRVTLTCGEHVLVLEAGDSCHYDGRVPHASENAGSAPAKLLVSMTPVTFERAYSAHDGAPHAIDSEIAHDTAP